MGGTASSEPSWLAEDEERRARFARRQEAAKRERLLKHKDMQICPETGFPVVCSSLPASQHHLRPVGAALGFTAYYYDTRHP